jgi:aspartate kinase
MWVMKVGGGCLRDAAGLRQLPQVLAQAGVEEPYLLVVSAFEKTTDRLSRLAEAALRSDAPAMEAIYAEIAAFHRNLIAEAFPPEVAARLQATLEERYWQPLYKRAQALMTLSEAHTQSVDGVLVFGELVSSTIVHAYLTHHGHDADWVDARRLLITDGSYPEPAILEGPTQASIDADLLPRFRRYPLVVTQGYIASDLRRHSVTLGREGSDYSAALFSAYLKARGMIAWKDVGRIYSADPKAHPDATPLTRLSYAQAAEMTFYGAKILHPRTLRPLHLANIPLYIRPYFAPHEEGTLITDRDYTPLPPIRLARQGLALLEIESLDLSPLSAGTLLQDLEDEGIEVYFMQAGVRQAAFAVRSPEETLQRWQSALPAYLRAQVQHPITLYTTLYPDETTGLPNGEALYFQRLPNRLHWLAYA